MIFDLPDLWPCQNRCSQLSHSSHTRYILGAMTDPQILQKEIERLRASVDELGALNEIATAIGSSQSLEDVNNRIVKMVVKRAKATQGAIFLLSEKNEKPMVTEVRVKDSSVKEDTARFGKLITGRVVKEQAPLNISRARDPEGLLARMPEFVTSVLSVPMKARGKFVGVLSVFNKRGEDGFSINDQRFLSILAAQSVQIIERIRFVDVEKNLAAIKKELSVARDIQAAFLPGDFPVHDTYEIFAQYTPADEVGGDSFDVIQASETKIIISQGDVTGHGVPAALMMASAQTAIRCKLESYLDGKRSFAEFVGGVSDYLFETSERHMFMTMFLAALDTETHTLEYVRAGHPTPFLCSGGAVEALGIGGLPLGIITGTEYESGSVTFKSGSRLLVYSDGITELENPESEQFGEKRLSAYLKNCADLDSRNFCAKLFEALEDFRKDKPPDDDITILTVRRK